MTAAFPTSAPSPSKAVEPAEASAADLAAARKTRAIALMILGVGLFSIMDALVKWLGEGYPTVQLVFFRSLFAFIPLAFLMFRDGFASALRVNDRAGHLLRALIGVLALWSFFYGFAHMPLADMIAITFAAPIFVTALSVPMLGEKVGLRRWCAVLVGFVGVVIMVQPGAGMFQSLALVPLAGVVFYALAMILVRKLSRTETSASIVFYFTLACTLISGFALPFAWVTPEAWDWALLVALGLIGGMAQITFTRAIALADVSVIMPFEYTAMLWAVVLGFFIWGEVPGNNIWIGVAIVIASGLYILYREASLGLPRGKARKLHAKR